MYKVTNKTKYDRKLFADGKNTILKPKKYKLVLNANDINRDIFDVVDYVETKIEKVKSDINGKSR